jgi:hypothetical protein
MKPLPPDSDDSEEVQIPTEMYEQLVEIAAALGRSPKDVLSEMLTKYWLLKIKRNPFHPALGPGSQNEILDFRVPPRLKGRE